MTDATYCAGSVSQPTLGRLLDGDRLVLGRLISSIENGTIDSEALVRALRAAGANAPTAIGITGPPGAGKSTLIAALAERYLDAQRRVAVLLVDPSSATTGGAVLADRVRIPIRLRSDELFVRSLASRGQTGGLAQVTPDAVALVGAWGADLVLIETVGAGQTDVAVADFADCTVVVCPPGLGDDMQAMKAGLMEVADIFVVNKADREGCDATAASLSDTGLGGRFQERRPVLRTIARDGQGVQALIVHIEGFTERQHRSGVSWAVNRTKESLVSHAATSVRRVVYGDSAETAGLIAEVSAGRLDLVEAGRRILEMAAAR